MATLLRGIAVDFLNSGLSGSYSIDVIIRENVQNAMVSGDEELLYEHGLFSNAVADRYQEGRTDG